MEQSLQQPINGWEKTFPACSSKPLLSINLSAKIRTRKNKSWMESLSLHMVYCLGTAMPSTEDLIELAL
jgi:hypothetical protein